MSTVAEPAQSKIGPVAALEDAPALQLEALRTNEIIELSIKPSLWYIPIISARWLLGAGVVAAGVAIGSAGNWQPLSAAIFNGAVCVAVLRLGVAALQWASRLFVLTNLRVLRFRGVLRVEVAEKSLVALEDASLRVAPYQRVLRLGSILMQPRDTDEAPLAWKHVARPVEIQQKVDSAIHRARHGHD